MGPLMAVASKIFQAGGYAARSGKAIGSSAASSATSGMAAILARELHYAQNRIGPTKVPEIDALIHLYWTRRITDAEFADSLNNQGILWNVGDAPVGKFGQQWRSLINLERPMHSLADYRRWFRRGTIDAAQWQAALEREGFGGAGAPGELRANNAVQGVLYQTDYDSLEENIILAMWQNGDLTSDEVRVALIAMGRRAADVEKLLFKFDQSPALGEILTLLNRGKIHPDVADYYVRHLGFRSADTREQLLSLRHTIPGPSDLVRYALREAWDPAVVARFEYDAEYPPELTYWMEKQGAGGDARTADQIAAGAPPVKWPQLDWRVHWQNIAPTMAYEMYHRLRPHRLARFGADFGGLRAFTFSDLETVLKVNDYPVPFRQQLAAINSQTLGRVDIRRMYNLGIMERTEVKELYLDAGYVEPDAEKLTKFAEHTRRITRANRFTRRTKASVIDAYNLGILSRTAASIAMYELQFVDPVELAAFRARPQGDREQLATQDQGVRFELTNSDAERALANGKTVVRTIHRLFVTGAIHDAGARSRLADVGIAAVRIIEYMIVWHIERFGPRKLLSTKQIQTAVAHRIMSPGVAQVRLGNLGYSPYDISVILSEANRSIALERAKAQQAAARTLQQQQHAQQAQIKALTQERRRMQNELARYATPKDLVNWYALDYVDGRTLQTRLEAILDDQTKIAAYIDDARDKRQKRLEKLGATA